MPEPRRPPEPNAAFLLIALGRQARTAVDEQLRAHDLTYRHFSALGHLAGEPGLSYSELARRAGVTVQSMQTTVGQLAQRGAVDRGATAAQGRRAELRITPAGRELLTAGRCALRRVERELLAGLPTAEGEALTAGLLAMFRATLRGG